ncbi:zinc finger protein 185 [Aplochiton taeniatus]
MNKSKEGDKASVFKSTKVRTKLKGDGSWMQSRNEVESEIPQEEKPWLAEVRARRVDGAPIETSPVSSPIQPTPAAVKPPTDRAPTTGYMISGPTNNFTKKPSESYKKIAPHTVRSTMDTPVQIEGQLPPDKKERREEAASNVLKTSSVRQRSYVLSAAKKYEYVCLYINLIYTLLDKNQTFNPIRIVTTETVDKNKKTVMISNTRGFVYLKEYVNTTDASLQNARDNLGSGSDYVTSSSSSYNYSSPPSYSRESSVSPCTYCGENVGNDAKITIDHLNISCHPSCFKCAVCSKPMGDLLSSMFLHGGKVHCETCYSNVLD